MMAAGTECTDKNAGDIWQEGISCRLCFRTRAAAARRFFTSGYSEMGITHPNLCRSVTNLIGGRRRLEICVAPARKRSGMGISMKNTKKKVIGYVGTKDLDGMREDDVRVLDVINIAFGGIKDNAIIWECPGAGEAMERLRRLNPGLKILLSVGGWSADGFSQAASSQRGREIFAESAVELMQRYHLDGIDIDWEYPGMSLAGIASSRNDGENFILLLEELRSKMKAQDAESMLTIAAGGDSYFTNQTDMKKAAAYLDYVQLMTYDLQGGFQKVTGHHSAVYFSKNNLFDACVDKCVRCFVQAGVPAEKLIVGIPFYSRIWNGVKTIESCENNGLGMEAESVGGYGPDYGNLLTQMLGRNGYVRYWDEDAKACYLFNGDSFVSYEDEESIEAKIAYVKENKLGGVMFWEYKCDTTHTLIKFIGKELKGEI